MITMLLWGKETVELEDIVVLLAYILQKQNTKDGIKDKGLLLRANFDHGRSKERDSNHQNTRSKVKNIIKCLKCSKMHYKREYQLGNKRNGGKSKWSSSASIVTHNSNERDGDMLSVLDVDFDSLSNSWTLESTYSYHMCPCKN